MSMDAGILAQLWNKDESRLGSRRLLLGHAV
jgi:hypothetical protein